jgi:hypothetical protein
MPWKKMRTIVSLPLTTHFWDGRGEPAEGERNQRDGGPLC